MVKSGRADPVRYRSVASPPSLHRPFVRTGRPNSSVSPVVEWWPRRFGLGCVLMGSEAGLQGTWQRESSKQREMRMEIILL